ncbi:MAG TPA: hypothetical protein VFM46_11435, partial [Pseudomonadales bacterium]|nr:hypothetical protein [Pseudomonadales bacterium]
CKEYIFKLTSGQFENAPLIVKLDARMHRMICKYCRAFTKNDQTLDQVIEGYREFKVEKGEE